MATNQQNAEEEQKDVRPSLSEARSISDKPHKSPIASARERVGRRWRSLKILARLHPTGRGQIPVHNPKSYSHSIAQWPATVLTFINYKLYYMASDKAICRAAMIDVEVRGRVRQPISCHCFTYVHSYLH
jgi:hypothetical protein